MQRLADAIDEKGLKILFGLEQQGHIPKIEEMLKDLGSTKMSWELIGKEIGWCPFTACASYVRYLQSQSKSDE